MKREIGFILVLILIFQMFSGCTYVKYRFKHGKEWPLVALQDELEAIEGVTVIKVWAGTYEWGVPEKLAARFFIAGKGIMEVSMIDKHYRKKRPPTIYVIGKYSLLRRRINLDRDKTNYFYGILMDRKAGLSLPYEMADLVEKYDTMLEWIEQYPKNQDVYFKTTGGKLRKDGSRSDLKEHYYFIKELSQIEYKKLRKFMP